MGIKSNFLQFLKTKTPESFEIIHLSEYAFRKVAIDVSLYMHKFKAVNGESWLISFINLVACLRKNEVHCVFIYDGQAPIEKKKEQDKRKNTKLGIVKQIKEIEDGILEYTNTGIANEALIQFNLKCQLKSRQPKRLISTNSEEINIKLIKEHLRLKKSQIISINSNDYELTRDLFEILEVPYFIASNEAEKMCSKLCIDGEVDAVLSEDTDTLAYGTPIFLSKIDISKSTCVRVNYKSLLENLEISPQQFLDFCILCGTDYNSNISGVGSVSSFKLIKKYESLENIGCNTEYDLSVLNYNRVRELFIEFSDSDKKTDVQYCGQPDFNILKNFLNSIELKINYDYLHKCFIREIIIMDEDDSK